MFIAWSCLLVYFREISKYLVYPLKPRYIVLRKVIGRIMRNISVNFNNLLLFVIRKPYVGSSWILFCKNLQFIVVDIYFRFKFLRFFFFLFSFFLSFFLTFFELLQLSDDNWNSYCCNIIYPNQSSHDSTSKILPKPGSHSGVFVVNFEQISHIVLVLLSLTQNK